MFDCLDYNQNKSAILIFNYKIAFEKKKIRNCIRLVKFLLQRFKMSFLKMSPVIFFGWVFP